MPASSSPPNTETREREAPSSLSEAVNNLNNLTVSANLNNPLQINVSNILPVMSDIIVFHSATDVLNPTVLLSDSEDLSNAATQTSSTDMAPLAPKSKRKRDEFPVIKTNASCTTISSLERFKFVPRSKLMKSVSFDLQASMSVDEQAAGATTPAASSASLPRATGTHPPEQIRESGPRRVAQLDESEATQTPMDLAPDQFSVNPKAMDIWLLSKKHRSYEQRATLRARLIEDHLKHGTVPLWALRRDYEPRPQYIECTPEMLALTKRHAREVAQQALNDLEAKAAEEQVKADDFLNITQQIYVKENDVNFFQAESRIVDIIDKYGSQEKRKLSAAYCKDRDAFPSNDEMWESSMAAVNKPGTSRGRRPRSGQRSTSGERKKRREDRSLASTSSPPPPPPPPAHTSHQASSSTAQQSGPSNKGKAGPNSKVKGASRRQGPQAAPQEPSTTSSNYNRPAQRGARGGGHPRGRGRGRGAQGTSSNYQQQDRSTFSQEDRRLFEEMKKHFAKNK